MQNARNGGPGRLPWHKHCATSNEHGAYDTGEAHARALVDAWARVFASPLAFPVDDELAAFLRGFVVTLGELVAPTANLAAGLRQFASHMGTTGAAEAMKLEGPEVERFKRVALRVVDELERGPGVQS